MHSFNTVLTYHSLLLFAAMQVRAAAVTAVPFTDCSIESAMPCAGIVYAPATWCQNNLGEALYSTVAGASGSAACNFTASPTAIILGIQSTYQPTDVPSCVSSLQASPATALSSANTAASAIATSSATVPLSSPALNIQPTSSAVATATAVAPAAPVHTANCTMAFQPAGWPQTTTIKSMPTGLIFQMYNYYGRDISPGIGASCTNAPKSCNFNSGGYPPSDKFAAFDSQLPYPFNWAIADVSGDTVFYYNYHSPDVASTKNEQGSWDLSALDWSQQQNFTWDCSAPKRVHQNCTATTAQPSDKNQDGEDTHYDVAINILDPDGNNVGGTTMNVTQPEDNDYEDHSNMQFFSFWTPLLTLRIGWDVTDGGGKAAFYFAYGENDYQTDGFGTLDKATGLSTTSTPFDCYYDDLDEPWLGP